MLSTFNERVTAYFTAAAAAAREWYTTDGAWRLNTMPSATRERFWLACGLYAVGADALADAVVRRGESFPDRPTTWDIFHTNVGLALLVKHRDQMAPDVRAKLEAWAEDGFSFKPGNREPAYMFHGYNDNMPAKAAMGLILGGELLDRPEAVEHGLHSLRQLRALLTRCGTVSEYNSPTYSPVTLHALAEIAELARHPEARALALAAEERLWLDLAARFHPETGVLAGPYSRAYTADTLAHASCLSSLLWFVLGDLAQPSPLLWFDRPAELVMHHMGDVPFNVAQMSWFASGTFHLPERARELFTRKEYPARAAALTEQGDYRWDFPARPARITTFLRPDFTVGTADTPFCEGSQTLSWLVTYRRDTEAPRFGSAGTVFTKLVVDDDVPGTVVQASDDRGVAWANSGESDHLHSFANTFTLQHDATALVLTHPHLALAGGPEGRPAPRAVTALSDLVIFPSHFGGAEELLVGGRPRERWDGEVAHGEWVVCRRGRLLLGLRPLAFTQHLGAPTFALETVNRYEVLRTRLYQGERRVLTSAELRSTFGGFVAEAASVDDWPSLAAFAERLAAGQFTDYLFTTRRTRYRRAGLELEVSLSPGQTQARFAAIDGRRVESPVAALDGLPSGTLPFLDAEPVSVPSYWPWPAGLLPAVGDAE